IVPLKGRGRAAASRALLQHRMLPCPRYWHGPEELPRCGEVRYQTRRDRLAFGARNSNRAAFRLRHRVPGRDCEGLRAATQSALPSGSRALDRDDATTCAQSAIAECWSEVVSHRTAVKSLPST